MTYDYPTAFTSHGAEERSAMARVIASGQFTMGAEVEAFEAELAAYHGRRHAVMVNSGSSANLIATAALSHCDGGWRRPAPSASFLPLLRDGFVAPAIAWSTSYAPPVQYGLIPTLVDVDDTWNAPSDDIFKMGWRYPPRLLIAVPVLGNPAHLASWEELGARLKIPLLVDACESIGARISGRQAASFGTVSTLSFFWSHQLSAIEGGCVLTDDDELARLCWLLRNHGNAGWGSEDLDASYNFEVMGYNLRPLELHAAVGREQLRKLDADNAERYRNAVHFREITANLMIEHQHLVGTPTPFGMAFVCETKEIRKTLALEFRAEGIDCRLPTGGSFRKHPYAASWAGQSTPNADRIHGAGMFLGNAPFPIGDLIERAARVMRRVL